MVQEGYEIWPESFQRIEKIYWNSALEQFQDKSLAITDLVTLSKADHEVALYPAIAEMNTAGFIGRSIKCYSTRHLQAFV